MFLPTRVEMPHNACYEEWRVYVKATAWALLKAWQEFVKTCMKTLKRVM